MNRLYRPLSVWREMDRIQREMDRLFSGYSPSAHRAAPSYPPINIWTKEEGQVITAEMPGIDPDKIEIDVVADSITLSGERNPDPEQEGMIYHRRERNHGKFSRTIQLPFMVDANKVEAKFTDGVLQITLPRAEADKPKKIAVKSA
ncbi:MAG: Hsp20/alpha crystallin family protein [Anaerolineales bacterium]|nr:Hsp20/alpha crystallin family protein [Anaerolineales bacterium]